MPHDSVIAGFWIVSMCLWEWCPCGLHSVTSRLLWHFCGFVVPLLFSFAIPIPEVIQCYHLFLYVSDARELISWSPAVLFFGVFFGCFCLCWLVLVFVVCFSFLHGDSLMDYVSILFSSPLYAHCHDWCCHCSNSVNLQNAIVFPAG